MSNDASILAQMQRFLWRAIESGRAPQLAPPTGTTVTRTQLCRVDVPMWMAGGWVVTVGPPPSSGHAPLQELPDGIWPVDPNDAYAEIRFAHGSANHTVEIDLSRGLRVCLYGSTIEVTLVQPPNPAGVFQFGFPYKVPGSIVRGELGTANHCRRTVYIGSIAPTTESSPHPIPPFARRAYIKAQFPAASVGQMNFYDAAGSVLLTEDEYQNRNQENKFGQGVLVPAEATAVTWRNGGALALNGVQIVFELHV